MNKLHQYNYLFEYLSCFSGFNYANNWLCSVQWWKYSLSSLRKHKSSYIPSDEYWLGGMLSIIFIHLGFWMGQQQSIPGGSSQVFVPSGHWYFSSGEKTLLEIPMKPFLLNSLSTCCEDFLQQLHVRNITTQHRLFFGHTVRPSGQKSCNQDYKLWMPVTAQFNIPVL